MVTFLVDRTLPGMTEDLLAEAHRLLQEAARRVSSSGETVQYLRCIYLPHDGRCLCLFEASDEAAVVRVNETAQVPFRRITSAIEFRAPGTERPGGTGRHGLGRAPGRDPEQDPEG